MNKADLLYLWDYNHWANEHVLHTADQVTPEQFVAPAPLSHGSLRGTLVHLVAVEQLWRRRCQEGDSSAMLPPAENFPTITAVGDLWRQETAAMRGFLEQLPDGEVRQTVTYTTFKGISHTDLLWQLLMHVIYHSMQFRSEASVLLTTYQYSPGDLDMLVFLREQQ